jgi:pumilio RNA-binding family
MNFIYDPNGNHVIQQSIQVMSRLAKSSLATNCGHDDPGQPSACLSDQMQFIIDEIIDNVEILSTHRYGCRVVQRAIQHCVDSQKLAVLEKIISCHEKLIIDQYGKMLLRVILSPRLIELY